MTYSKFPTPPSHITRGLTTFPGSAMRVTKVPLTLCCNSIKLNLQGTLDTGTIFSWANKSVFDLLHIQIYHTPNYDYGYIKMQRGRKRFLGKVICGSGLSHHKFILGTEAIAGLLTPNEAFHRNVLALE